MSEQESLTHARQRNTASAYQLHTTRGQREISRGRGPTALLQRRDKRERE